MNITKKALTGRFFVTWILFTLAYSLLALICLKARDPWSLSSTVWLPAGLTLIALCHSTLQNWPIWIFTSGIIHAAISLIYGRSPEVTLLFTLADILIFAGTALVWRRIAAAGFHQSLFNMSLYCCLSVVFMCFTGGLILEGVFRALDYPVELRHSLVWGISGATGALATASFFIFDGGNVTYYLTHLYSFSRKKIFILLVTFAVGCVFILPVHFINLHIFSCYASLFIVWTLTVVLTLTCSTLFVALFFLFISLVISLGSLYGMGPFSCEVYGSSGIFSAQIYLLLLIVTNSIIFARIKELRSSLQGFEKFSQLIASESPARGFLFFQFYPLLQNIEWTESPHNDIYNTQYLVTPDLFLGRVHEDKRATISDFIKNTYNMSTIRDHAKFRLPFMDDALVYRDVTLIFSPPEFRGKNLRVAGTIVFH